jgi:hypothetical protein
MLVLAAILTLGAWMFFGWRFALGMACGCAVAYLNFHWLKSGVEALADRIVEGGKPQSRKGIVFRFLLRYVLMGLVAYLNCFPREPLRALCRPVPSRSGHRVRSRLRSLRGLGAWSLKSASSYQLPVRSSLQIPTTKAEDWRLATGH